MIYLDYNATTPVDEQVLQSMLPYFNVKFGNAASSTHIYGLKSKDAVENARATIAKTINCDLQEVIFTSGATEALNLAIKGVFNSYYTKGNHIVTVATEHKAVLDTCKYLEKKGAEITYLPVDNDGLINLETLENAITDKTILVCVMYANNETGVLQNIQEISKITHQKNTIFCCDATQAIGKIPVDVQEFGMDLMCVSAHKFYGPKGIGALYIRRKNPRVALEALIHGGGHERSWRSGTLNTPAIVGVGKACEIITFENDIEKLRDYFEDILLQKYPTLISINGKNAKRLPNTSNVLFPFKATDFIHHTKNKLAIATGSACTSSENLPSHVLTAMGLTKEQAEKSVRFSLGKFTSKSDIDVVLALIKSIIEK